MWRERPREQGNAGAPLRRQAAFRGSATPRALPPMIHPATELRPVNARIGYGVFATQPIPAGTITWVRDRFDQSLPADSVRDLPGILHKALLRYSYRDTDGSYVLCWDHARFNNHSCEPACRTVDDFDVAVRDIPTGGELTIDYGVINVPEALDCHCGAASCRGVIRAMDADRLGDAWDAEVLAAIQRSPSVAQPLADLFPGTRWLPLVLGEMGAGRPPRVPPSRNLILRDVSV